MSSTFAQQWLEMGQQSFNGLKEMSELNAKTFGTAVSPSLSICCSIRSTAVQNHVDPVKAGINHSFAEGSSSPNALSSRANLSSQSVLIASRKIPSELRGSSLSGCLPSATQIRLRMPSGSRQSSS